MKPTSKRLEFLEKTVAASTADPFPMYGLALEYRGLDRVEDAETAFKNLRSVHPSYVPMYLMAGQFFEKVGRKPDAREWLEAGIIAAQAKRDTHALGELQGALEALG